MYRPLQQKQQQQQRVNYNKEFYCILYEKTYEEPNVYIVTLGISASSERAIIMQFGEALSTRHAFICIQLQAKSDKSESSQVRISTALHQLAS